MKRNATAFVLTSFLVWRLVLLVIVFLAIKLVELQHNFLGGGYSHYISNPYLWAWLNFDGEHYLSIIQDGYKPLTYFFFPGFPLVVRYMVQFFGQDTWTYAALGLVISNLIFLIGLFGFWKLVTLDFDEKIARLATILLLVFPTSFYFGSFYTESLFFTATVWSLYFARTNKWLLSGIFGGLSALTRIIGVAMFPALVSEMNLNKKNNKWSSNKMNLIYVAVVPFSLCLYMYYLWRVTGDPLNFLHTISIFGGQRSSNFVLLPQVFYRYIFKIIPNLNINYFPATFSTLLEFVVGILFLFISIISIYKLRLSYALLVIFGYLIPTLSGSFSSLPRYVLVLFPAFILVSLWLNSKSNLIKISVFVISFVCLLISTMMFVRGYWIS